MSFFTLLNYLHNEANKDENTQKLWKLAAEKIEENEKLEACVKAKFKENSELEMQVYTLELLAELRAQESEQQKLAELTSKEAYDSCLKLCSMLKRVDLQKTFGFELQTQQLQLQDELQKMEQDFLDKHNMYEEMENRPCVQELRQQQREHAAAQAELEKAKNAAAVANEAVLKNLATAKKQRNDTIIRLIEGSRELAKIREEICGLDAITYEEARLEQKKIELTNKLQELQETQDKENGITFQKQPIDALAISLEQNHIGKVKVTGDTPEPMSFFKSVFLEAKKMPSMWEYFAELQAKKQSEGNQKQTDKSVKEVFGENKSLRSILQNPSMDTNGDLTPKHVHFTLSSEDENNATPTPPPRYSTPKKPFEKAAVAMTTQESKDSQVTMQETEDAQMPIIDLNTPTEEMDSDEPSPEYELLSGDELYAENVPETTKIGETKRSNIEIQECRIVKPAGTALPKVLPTNLSPEVQCGRATEIPDIQAQSIFKVPPPPAAMAKPSNYSNSFDEFLKCSDNLESDSDSSAVAEPKHEISNEKNDNNLKKQQHQLKNKDFESLVQDSMVDMVASDEGSVEESDDDILNMGQSEEMLDFNTEDADDKFSLEFNDFDPPKNKRNDLDFL